MARKLRLLIEEQKIPLKMLYLFGSAARGDMRKWSDVDIAVICRDFDETPLKEYCAIAKLAYKIDPRISILYFRENHFDNPWSGVVREVKREGIGVE